MRLPRYKNGFRLTLHEEDIESPLSWRNPQMVFVNSMSDLFHNEVPIIFIQRIFDVMTKAKRHIFQVLTKRAKRLAELSPNLSWSNNIWMGVSIENNNYLSRIEALVETPASVRFLSLEPLLGPIDNLPLDGIDWVIVGGESGPYSRPMKKEWCISIRDQCLSNNIPFFFKQWGGFNKKKTGRELEGRTWDELPSSKNNECLQLSSRIA